MSDDSKTGTPTFEPTSTLVSTGTVVATGTLATDASATPTVGVDATTTSPVAGQAVEPGASATPARAGSIQIAASSHTGNTNDAGVLFDDDPATLWQTSGDAPRIAVLQLDLGSAQAIGELAFLPGLAGAADGVVIETSLDGETWLPVTFDDPIVAGTWSIVDIDTTARHVRFVIVDTLDRPVLGGIAEVIVYPPPLP